MLEERMSQPPPVPLDYRGALPPGGREPFVVQFFLGLLLGIGASTLIWWFGMNKLVKSKSPRSETIWIILLFIVPMAKGAAGWACVLSGMPSRVSELSVN